MTAPWERDIDDPVDVDYDPWVDPLLDEHRSASHMYEIDHGSDPEDYAEAMDVARHGGDEW